MKPLKIIQHQLTLANGSVQFNLKYTRRKSLCVVVHPDASISVAAPLTAPMEKIEAFLKARGEWILKKQKYFAKKIQLSGAQENFYDTEQVQYFFEQRLNYWAEFFPAAKIKPPRLRLRKMKSLWGSCAPDGAITLNTRLIATTPACIDYVICHELAHLTVRNHSKKFYDHLGSVMPDWKVRRRDLTRYSL